MQVLALWLALSPASAQQADIAAEYSRLLGCSQSSIQAKQVSRSTFRVTSLNNVSAYGADYRIRGCGSEFIVAWAKVEIKAALGMAPVLRAYFDDREVRARAPIELECASDQVEVTWLGNHTRLAKGCGGRITYVFDGEPIAGGTWSADVVQLGAVRAPSSPAAASPPVAPTPVARTAPKPAPAPAAAEPVVPDKTFATDPDPLAMLELTGPKNYPFESEYGEGFGGVAVPLGSSPRTVTVRRSRYSDDSWTVRAWVDGDDLVVDDGMKPPTRLALRGADQFRCTWSAGRGVEKLAPR